MTWRKSKSGGSRRAFTLIEILVVVAIIALLAAIIFPVFGRARENARRTACLSYMKQLGLALMQYTQDFDEKLPINNADFYVDYGVDNFGDPGARTNFLAAILPYTKSKGILNCPSTVDSKQADRAPTATSSASYVGNAVVIRTQTAVGSFAAVPVPLSLSAIPNTAEIIFMQEIDSRTRVASTYPVHVQQNNNIFLYWHVTSGGVELLSNNHFGGGNLLFTDGHAKWRAVSSLRAKEFGLADGATTTPSNDTIAAPSNTFYTALFKAISLAAFLIFL